MAENLKVNPTEHEHSHSSNETTKLTPMEEVLFKAWTKANGIEDADAPDSFYDYRGFYKGTNGQIHGAANKDHFPDTYKTHGHPTFSQESKYSRGPWDGGMWMGEHFLPQPPMALSHTKHENVPAPPVQPIASHHQPSDPNALAQTLLDRATDNPVNDVSSPQEPQ